jgi:hypothetical protein
MLLENIVGAVGGSAWEPWTAKATQPLAPMGGQGQAVLQLDPVYTAGYPTLESILFSLLLCSSMIRIFLLQAVPLTDLHSFLSDTIAAM